MREFQEEIMRLKAELAASASQLQAPAQPREHRVERIVERALSPEEVLAMRTQMEQEMQQEAVQQGEPLDADTLAKVSHHLCYIVLFSVVLCYTGLCCVLRCAVLYCVVLCCDEICCDVM